MSSVRAGAEPEEAAALAAFAAHVTSWERSRDAEAAAQEAARAQLRASRTELLALQRTLALGVAQLRDGREEMRQIQFELEKGRAELRGDRAKLREDRAAFEAETAAAHKDGEFKSSSESMEALRRENKELGERVEELMLERIDRRKKATEASYASEGALAAQLAQMELEKEAMMREAAELRNVRRKLLEKLEIIATERMNLEDELQRVKTERNDLQQAREKLERQLLEAEEGEDSTTFETDSGSRGEAQQTHGESSGAERNCNTLGARVQELEEEIRYLQVENQILLDQNEVLKRKVNTSSCARPPPPRTSSSSNKVTLRRTGSFVSMNGSMDTNSASFRGTRSFKGIRRTMSSSSLLSIGSRKSSESAAHLESELIKSGYLLVADGKTISGETRWVRRFVAIFEKAFSILPNKRALEIARAAVGNSLASEGTPAPQCKWIDVCEFTPKLSSDQNETLCDLIVGPERLVQKALSSKIALFDGKSAPFVFRGELEEMKVWSAAIIACIQNNSHARTIN